jgi:hypothetical protein
MYYFKKLSYANQQVASFTHHPISNATLKYQNIIIAKWKEMIQSKEKARSIETNRIAPDQNQKIVTSAMATKAALLPMIARFPANTTCPIEAIFQMISQMGEKAKSKERRTKRKRRSRGKKKRRRGKGEIRVTNLLTKMT